MSFPDSNESPNKQINEEEFNSQKESILKQILTSEARMRLNNIKMVKPDLSNMVEQYLIGLASQGRMNSQITDTQLKQIVFHCSY